MSDTALDTIKKLEEIDLLPSPESSSSPKTRDNLKSLGEQLAGQKSRSAISRTVLIGLIRGLEFSVIMSTGFVSFILWQDLETQTSFHDLLLIVSVPLLCLLLFQALEVNEISAFRLPLEQCLKIGLTWSLIFLTPVLMYLTTPEFLETSNWQAGWFVLGGLSLILSRLFTGLIVNYFNRNGRLNRRTVVVGGGVHAEMVLQNLMKQKGSDLQIYGFFDDRADERSTDVIAGFPKLGNVDELVAFGRHTHIDLIIFALPITAEMRILQMLRKLWVLPSDIRLAAHGNKLRFRPRSYSYVGDMPVLDVVDRPIADWDVIKKSIFDRVIGFLILVALSPLMLLIALAVRLDSPGPIFFRQKRYGFNNQVINIFKFRSLYKDKEDVTGAQQVTRTDSRVTRVGRILRKSSLDELPQLFNVVFYGNLSLVGPRPHTLTAQIQNRAYEVVVDGYFARHRVRPGMTGWAQINGWRGETDTLEKIQRRVEHDLYYIENWSIGLDLYILARTPLALIKHDNAY